MLRRCDCRNGSFRFIASCGSGAWCGGLCDGTLHSPGVSWTPDFRPGNKLGFWAESSPKQVGCHSMADALSPTMTLRDFENSYWYLEQLKNFAERIGIPAAKKLRKDELEKAIVAFLRTGKAALPTKRSLRKTGVRDVERGLNRKLRIENYTSNRETKDFIVEQAH